jgi:hypothetical protein
MPQLLLGPDFILRTDSQTKNYLFYMESKILLVYNKRLLVLVLKQTTNPHPHSCLIGVHFNIILFSGCNTSKFTYLKFVPWTLVRVSKTPHRIVCLSVIILPDWYELKGGALVSRIWILMVCDWNHNMPITINNFVCFLFVCISKDLHTWVPLVNHVHSHVAFGEGKWKKKVPLACLRSLCSSTWELTY